MLRLNTKDISRLFLELSAKLVNTNFLTNILSEIMQLKNNSIPKGLIPLEDLFDKNDFAKNMRVTPNNDEVEDYNIGTNVDKKIIKLSEDLDSENAHKYITLMK